MRATEERLGIERPICELIRKTYTICRLILLRINIPLVRPVQSRGPARSGISNVRSVPASFFCPRTDTLELNIATRKQYASVLAREPSKLMSIVQLVFSFCFERTVFPDGSRYAKSGLSPSWYGSTPHSCPAITRFATTLAILARE